MARNENFKPRFTIAPIDIMTGFVILSVLFLITIQAGL